jgi:hypothetical protein
MSAVAVRDAVLRFLSRAAFEAFAKKHPALCQSLLRLPTKRVHDGDKMVSATSFLLFKGRISQTLLELADHFGQEGGPGRVVIPSEDQAESSCRHGRHARENVTRILNDWQRRKLVSRCLATIALRIRRYSSIKLSIEPFETIETVGRPAATAGHGTPRVRSSCLAFAGRYFAKQLAQANADGRIGRGPIFVSGASLTRQPPILLRLA